MNANGRRIDVWLVYRCDACGVSWNRTVLERKTPEEIGDLLVRYETNDRDLAWRHAFETAGASVQAVDVHVERTGASDIRTIVLSVPWPVSMRLDRLLARELGIPRTSLSVADTRALRRPIRDGQVVEIGG